MGTRQAGRKKQKRAESKQTEGSQVAMAGVLQEAADIWPGGGPESPGKPFITFPVP